MKLKYIIIAGILLVVGLTIASTQGWLGKKQTGKEVFTQKLGKVDIVETVTASGKIQPEKEVKISSDVSGEIIELPVKEGQQVKKGNLLVKINPDLYQSGLKRARASLQNSKASLSQASSRLIAAEQDFKRKKQLFEKGIISKADFQASETNYKVAVANKNSARFTVASAIATLNEAKDNLARTTIYAPISGTISRLNVELGERVVGTKQMTGTEIMRIANLNNMEVEVDVNENDIVKLKVGDSANIEVDAYLKEKFKGIITEIANSADNKLAGADQVTNFKVKIRILENSYRHLMQNKSKGFSPFRPGMTASVDIITNVKKNILAVPISAVTVRSDTTSVKKNKKREKMTHSNKKFEVVFVNDKGKAKIKVVETGIQDDNNIEILKGLSEGDEIITGPYKLVSKTLKSGNRVQVKNKSKK